MTEYFANKVLSLKRIGKELVLDLYSFFPFYLRSIYCTPITDKWLEKEERRRLLQSCKNKRQSNDRVVHSSQKKKKKKKKEEMSFAQLQDNV